jgi:hypothetical protein
LVVGYGTVRAVQVVPPSVVVKMDVESLPSSWK